MKNQIFSALIKGLTPKHKPKKGTKTMKNQTLNGINAIEDYTNLQSVTLLRLKKDFQFPMEHDKGGAVWTADRLAIKAWFKQRKCTPRTVTTEKLKHFEQLKRQAAGKGRKHKRTLTGLAQIADFLGFRDHLKPYDWLRYYDGCPIKRNAAHQPETDADALLQWLAEFELETGEDLRR